MKASTFAVITDRNKDVGQACILNISRAMVSYVVKGSSTSVVHPYLVYN